MLESYPMNTERIRRHLAWLIPALAVAIAIALRLVTLLPDCASSSRSPGDGQLEVPITSSIPISFPSPCSLSPSKPGSESRPKSTEPLPGRGSSSRSGPESLCPRHRLYRHTRVRRLEPKGVLQSLRHLDLPHPDAQSSVPRTPNPGRSNAPALSNHWRNRKSKIENPESTNLLDLGCVGLCTSPPG